MRWCVAPPEHYSWIAQRAQIVPGPTFQAIAAFDDDGQIRGMVGYDGWLPNAVHIHLAVDSPIAMRCLLRPGFAIPFVEMNRQVLIGHVLSTNEQAIKLDKHLGFRELCRIRDAWAPGIDIVVLEMRREECRWIRGMERKKEAA